MNFTAFNSSIPPVSERATAEAARRWDDIAKPIGSLGALETAVTRMAGVMDTPKVRLNKRAVLVLCADNGVCRQGVAQTPVHITGVMSAFIAKHRSSVCIMADYARADVIPVDMGLMRAVDEPRLIRRRIADGTSDFTLGPAMTADEAERAIEAGMALADDCKRAGYDILLTGEMGIGNTTTSAAMAAVLTGCAVTDVTGRGAGLSDAGLTRKLAAIERGIAVNRPDPVDAFDVLHKLGGLDIAGLCGVFLGGAKNRMPVVIDGFISSVAALTAVRLCPSAQHAMLASHISAEPAGGMILQTLGLQPLICANMRLGEGTGAVAALPLLDMALSVYDRLMTYADIGM